MKALVIFNNLILAAFSLIIFWLMTGLYIWSLVWIGLAPFFAVVFSKGLKNSVIVSIGYGMLFTAVGFHWFAAYKLWTFLLGVIMFTSFFVLLNIISKAFLKFLGPFAVPIAWMFLIFIYSFIPAIGSFWVDFAFFQPATAPFIWYIGSYGITFLIILSNSSIAYLFHTRRMTLLPLVILLLLIPVTSAIYTGYAKTEGRPLKVALIQGNVTGTWFWRMARPLHILEKYERLTLEAAARRPDIIVWPEHAIPDDALKSPEVFERISQLAKISGSYLIAGSITDIDDGMEKVYDSALMFAPDGSLASKYDSIKPFPFDRHVAAAKGEQSQIKGEGWSASIGICYEEVERSVFNKSADFYISMVNNQTFDHTKGMELISLFPRLRAAEGRKFLIRAANTGITEIIDPFGNVVSRMKPYKEEYLIGTIYY